MANHPDPLSGGLEDVLANLAQRTDHLWHQRRGQLKILDLVRPDPYLQAGTPTGSQPAGGQLRVVQQPLRSRNVNKCPCQAGI